MKLTLRTTLMFLLAAVLATAQTAEKEDDKTAVEFPTKVISSTVTKVEAVVEAETQVDFKQARLADMEGKSTTIELADKVTIVEYWSRNANHTNLYWNRMRELEHKYANDPNVQVISINYDFALGGDEQRKAVRAYLKKNSAPGKLMMDLDDGVRDIFSLAGTIGYMLFNHNRQFIYNGRGDAPETEALFTEFEKALDKKEKWDDYVEKMMGSTAPQN